MFTVVVSRRRVVVAAIGLLVLATLAFLAGRSLPQVEDVVVSCLSASKTISCMESEDADEWTYGVHTDVSWIDSAGTFHEDGRPDCLPPSGRGLEGPVRIWWTEVSAGGLTTREVVRVQCL